MKIISDKIIEPNDTDNKRPFKSLSSNNARYEAWWKFAINRGEYPLPDHPTFKNGDRVSLKNRNTGIIVFGRISGTCNRNQFRVTLDGLSNGVWASSDNQSTACDYKLLAIIN